MPETPAPNMHHVSPFHTGEQAMQQRTGMREHMEQVGSWDAAQR
jgi:hypothetical protein